MSRLRVESLTRRFGGLVANDFISFEVPPEGISAVIGPNGAGKTTLFSMISGFLHPTAGRIFFEDEDVTGISPERIAKRGLVRTFQLAQLFQNLTVLENVKVGRHVCTKAGLWASLARPGWARREEAETARRAHELIAFVGLQGQADCSLLPCHTVNSVFSRLHARWPQTPNSCCSMNRPPASITMKRAVCRKSSAASLNTVRPFS